MYSITSIDETRPEHIGRKAWNLFLLKKHFLIPEFCVVTTKAYQDFKKHKKIMPQLERELRKVLEQFFEKGSIAIRSSGTVEDLSGASFAGMYTTTLNLSNVDDVLAAIIRTWESNDSVEVKRYCEAMRIPRGDMAVIIQHQLKPDISGVMVTQSPFSVQEVLIECCRGTGEKLVSGKITPTRYRIRGDVIKKEGKDMLTEDQIAQLMNIGKKVERLFKSPQDIEWAIANGRCCVLQSRPVLVQKAVPRRHCTVWTNANVRETIPDPISPLCWSIFDGVFFPYMFTDVFEFPITRQQYYNFRPVELLSGRLYWNVNNTIAFMKAIGPVIDLIGGGEAIDPQFVSAFKAVDIRRLPEPVPRFKMYVFTIISIFRLSYYIGLGFFRYGWMSRKMAKSHAAFDVVHKTLTPVDDLALGLQNVQKWFELILKRFTRRYFGGIFLSAFYLALLSKLLSLRLGKKGGAIARKTILGILDKTGEMVLAVNNLAAIAKRKLKRLTISRLRHLHKTDDTFRTEFDQFLQEFGHRGPAEFDVASINWREDPDLVYGLIRTAEDTEKRDIDRTRLIHDLLNTSRPFERFLLKLFIPRIEAFTPFRENGKHIYFRFGSKIKDQLLVMARIMQRSGFLEKERDIFFLTLPDIEGVSKSHYEKVEILQRIFLRKKQWSTYEQIVAPEIIYETGERITPFAAASNILSAEPLSFGKVKAKVRIISNFRESRKLKQGEILVTHHTDPGWTPLFTICSGVIIEVGGLICHAAMVARELGVPAVVLRGAVSLIPDGQLVELDADEGFVKIISKSK